MEEVPTSSPPEDGQFQSELPEALPKPETRAVNPQIYGSFATAENRLGNVKLESDYDPNTLPQPVEPETFGSTPEQTTLQTPETEFEKRNERLRQQPKQQDELAAAGMVTLGDVLKNRQVPYTPQPGHTLTGPVQTTSNATNPSVSLRSGWSLYRQAIAVGLVAGLIMAPIIVLILARS